jgi:hypothetical protein
LRTRADPDSDDGSDCDSDYAKPAIVYLLDGKNQAAVQRIRDKLQEQNQNFYEARSDRLAFTAFFWVEEVFRAESDELKNVPGVSGRLFKTVHGERETDEAGTGQRCLLLRRV